MKLLRVGPPGEERVAVLGADDGLVDVSDVVDDLDPAFFAAGGIGRLRERLAGRASRPATGARIGPPIRRPGKIVCIGLNYRDHAEETGAALPAEPVVFLKAPDTVVGPDDTVLVPRGSSCTDWEVELGVVIGRPARYLESHEAAMACVAGYVVSHDVSEREFQLHRGGQWDKGKSCETFNPMGPWFVTADEIADPQQLGLRLWVNGTLRQDGNTKDMVFGVAEIIRYLSHFMTLYPGDLINTGTPAGVALGRPEPRPYLRPGDVVELEIDGLGRQRQTVGAA
ncbi:FAA hydrolase family protein [Micromonospora sp. BL1]|uniref:fumarylacetoacetate hydrolase family protein n=1 Tax=Micromonospora sp. BL1 TaxID=2478709 RepID=UPI000EF5624B|nr:fumarylacetoacetate hydrolase family protein [Micromonospora sp. BL1]RLQ04205.1 FAA hydrolase family protein [Micromonospora sp. BL1]